MTPPPQMPTDSRTPVSSNLLMVIGIGLLLTLLYQIRFPGQSYPEAGILQISLLLGFNLITLLLRMKHNAFTRLRLFSPQVIGAAFLLYAFMRWLADKTPYWGMTTLSLWYIAALWFAAVSQYLALYRASGKDFLQSKSVIVGGLLIAGIAVFSGFDAIYQYFIRYDQLKAELLKEIGNRPPTDIETGLLHHFNVKRVASVWGDPNILALVATLGVIWSATQIGFRAAGQKFMEKPLRFLPLFVIPVCLLTIGLSGSRGGLLDTLLAAGLISFFAFHKRWRKAAYPLAVAMTCIFVFQKTAAASSPFVSSSNRNPAAWFQRSDTVRERANYYRVAVEMIKQNPIFGLGVGSTEGYFGQFKPPEARESKFIHNWPLQIWAETGIIGLVLILGFLASVLNEIRKKKELLYSPLLWIPVSWGIILFDGLIQLSAYQREILCLWACLTAISVNAGTGAFTPLKGNSKQKYTQLLAVLLVTVPFTLIYIFPDLKGSIHRENAVAYWKEANPAQSLESYSQAIKYQPKNPGLYIARSRVFMEAGNTSLALADAKNAAAIQPLSASAYNNLSEIYLAAKSPESALSVVNEAIRLYPFKADYHFQKSKVLQEQQDRNNAIKEADLAVQYGEGLPGFSTFLNHRNTLQESAVFTRQ